MSAKKAKEYAHAGRFAQNGSCATAANSPSGQGCAIAGRQARTGAERTGSRRLRVTFADWNARKVVRSLVGAVVVMFLVSIIAFALSYLSPTDAAVRSFSGVGIAPTEEQLAAKRAELGLDQPFLVQYFTWVGNIFQGDLGTSYRTNAPVAEMLFQAIPYTLALSVTSILLTLAIAVPIGLVCAAHRGSIFDRIMRFVTYFFNSLPSFFVALLLLYVFSVRLRLVGVMSTRDLAGILMPTLAMALPLSAWFARQVRAQAIEQLGSGYVEGLRARGVSEARILWVHVLRNLSVPLLTLVGVSFGLLLGGSAIVESIFNWPGIGLAAIEAVGHRDYPFIGAYALAMAIIYLVINALVDGSYRLIDPRVGKRASSLAKECVVASTDELVNPAIASELHDEPANPKNASGLDSEPVNPDAPTMGRTGGGRHA